VNLRQQTASDWTAFAQAANALYDGMITAFGHQEMASNQKPIEVPNTEISFFTDSTGQTVEALLLESPEPLPWQRIWRWITLNSAAGSERLFALWSADGTRALLFPRGNLVGTYNLEISFQGNLGPELPCITEAGGTFSENVNVGPITMGKYKWAFPSHPILNVGDLAAAPEDAVSGLSALARHPLTQMMNLIRRITTTGS
jgi:hypothetical protein